MPNAANTPVVGKETPADMRAKILALEAAMHAMPEHQIEIKTTHHFAPGVYCREVLIPKGATVVGKIHKTEHLNILSQGELTVWTDEGMKRIKAPATILSKPGIKRVGFAHEDSVWTTIHPTTETDLEKLEEMLIAKDFDAVPGMGEKPLIEEKK